MAKQTAATKQHNRAAKKLDAAVTLAELMETADAQKAAADKAKGADKVRHMADWHRTMALIGTEERKAKAAGRAKKSRAGQPGNPVAAAASGIGKALNRLGIKL